jgi:hypothetical protein
LSEKRADSYRRYSDALALERAGVKYERPEEMVRLDEAEVAADAAVRAVQSELRDIDAEIKLMPQFDTDVSREPLWRLLRPRHAPGL